MLDFELGATAWKLDIGNFIISYCRDLTNGYLVAEIFSWYYPQEIQMHMYNNGTSLDSKQKNWSLLRNVSRPISSN